METCYPIWVLISKSFWGSPGRLGEIYNFPFPLNLLKKDISTQYPPFFNQRPQATVARGPTEPPGLQLCHLIFQGLKRRHKPGCRLGVPKDLDFGIEDVQNPLDVPSPCPCTTGHRNHLNGLVGAEPQILMRRRVVLRHEDDGDLLEQGLDHLQKPPKRQRSKDLQVSSV